ncbi:hypothetical protein E4O78_06890 [Neisseria meningitidis]|nr:hypothetical protein [Neisseria meningitidis]MBG8727929.1 hypothetical protein [Neisseria meningitidis]
MPQSQIPSFPRKWESRISDFQIIFEYCRRHSRLRGNDGGAVSVAPDKFLKLKISSFPLSWE